MVYSYHLELYLGVT